MTIIIFFIATFFEYEYQHVCLKYIIDGIMEETNVTKSLKIHLFHMKLFRGKINRRSEN